MVAQQRGNRCNIKIYYMGSLIGGREEDPTEFMSVKGLISK